MSIPRVSVVVPNFNHGRFLNQRIDSVLNQTWQDFEIILLDDCSTDDSRVIIESYRSNEKVTQIVYNTQNTGSPFKQWKKGIKLAKGEYIWVAESDDWAEPTFLEVMVQHLENGHGLAYCRSDEVDERGKFISDIFWADGLHPERWKRDYTNTGNNEVKNFLLYRCTIPNASACVFRKELAPLNCGFDKMKYCGDWLFWIRLLETCSLAYISQTLNHFRHHNASTRKRKSTKEEHRKRLEIIGVIEYVRKVCGLGTPEREEFEKYEWVQKGFYRELLIPTHVKHRVIFYCNRHFPGLYNYYRKLKEHVSGK